MLKIIYENGKSYLIEQPQWNIKYFGKEDHWGNTSLKFDREKMTFTEIITQIDCNVLPNAVGVLCNNSVHGLNEYLDYDCNLKVLTLQDDMGRKIIHNTLGLLLLKSIHDLDAKCQLENYVINEDNVFCQYRMSTLLQTITEEELRKKVNYNIMRAAKIEIKEVGQKIAILDHFSILEQPYCKEQMNNIDDYDFVQFVFYEDFVFLTLHDRYYLPTSDLKVAYWIKKEVTLNSIVLKGGTVIKNNFKH